MKNQDIISFYQQILCKDRIGESPSDKIRTSILEHVISDRGRIIYSSPFRRMQQKAQVFSLETNAAVRSRLTHTLEVAHIGQEISQRIVNEVFNTGLIEGYELGQAFVRMVENACFLHDIGNPPFGHFGEYAIQKWFKEKCETILKQGASVYGADNEYGLRHFQDFFQFDGNPQGIRIAISLQERPSEDKVNGTGLNLLCSQILSFVKYPYNSGHPDKEKNAKPGFFDSEMKKIELCRKQVNFFHRFPLVYIMEAADDISYCLSDIDDGIEKGLITPDEFFKDLTKEMQMQFSEKKLNVNMIEYFDFMPAIGSDETEPSLQGQKLSDSDFFNFKTKFSRFFIKYAANSFLRNHDSIVQGKFTELIEKESPEGILLAAIKNVSRRRLYSTWDAEKNEIAGYKIIYGLLDVLSPLLFLTFERQSPQKGGFEDLLKFHKGEKIDFKGLDIDIERRLFNTLPRKYLLVYMNDLEKLKKSYEEQGLDFKLKELTLRSHLITDYISGMTDTFALERYKVLHGINII